MTGVSRLAIRVRGDRAELALAELLPMLRAGAEERAAGGDVEYVVYAPEGELPRRADIAGVLGDMLVDVTVEPVQDGWERRWHDHLRPVTVTEAGRSLTVRPPWVAGDPGDLVIDPDVYFGAGTHETTRLCLRMLLLTTPAGALCDWGAGCGVLAVAAARLGWSPVAAVDSESGAVGVIGRNAAANGVAVTTRRLDLRSTPAPWAPTVCVNVPGELLRALPGVIQRPPERMFVAGMLRDEADDVIAAFAPLGLRERRRIAEGGWVGAVLA